MEAITTKVFINANSQAIRILKEFRLNTDKAKIIAKKDYHLITKPLRLKDNEKLWPLDIFSHL